MIVSGLTCRYCGRPARLIRDYHKGVYLSRLIWFCPVCNAQCGAMPRTREPIGIMADEKLRLAHHRLFKLMCRLKRSGQISEMYIYLAEQLKTPVVHIEDLDEDQTLKAIQILEDLKERGVRPWKKRRIPTEPLTRMTAGQ